LSFALRAGGTLTDGNLQQHATRMPTSPEARITSMIEAATTTPL